MVESDHSDAIQLEPIQLPSISKLFPFPGFTRESAEKVRELLDENHKTFHCFFNDSHFHNHLSHHLLASLSLGSPASIFPRILQKEDLDPSFHLNQKPQKPVKITEDNWLDYVEEANSKKESGGSEKDGAILYWSYLEFFDKEIRDHGIGKTLEKFVFSEEGVEKGLMLSRVMGGALHPLIHIGYGAEFEIGGIVAEGLAMTICTSPLSSSLFPSNWHALVGPKSTLALQYSTSNSSNIIQNISKRISSMVVSQDTQVSEDSQSNSISQPVSSSNPRAGLSIFSLTTLMSLDSRLAPGTATTYSSEEKMKDVLTGEVANTIEEYCRRWIVVDEDLEDPISSSDGAGWWTKLEELVMFNTLLLGSTSKPNSTKSLKHDFFLMHCNNSGIFLPSLLPLLSKNSRSLLLHSYFRTIISVWVARGRPRFYIDETLNTSTENPIDPIKLKKLYQTFSDDAKGEDIKSIGRSDEDNPWLGLLEAVSHHTDEHLVKAIRTLSYWNTRFSNLGSGSFGLQEEALEALALKVLEKSKVQGSSPTSEATSNDQKGNSKAPSTSSNINDFSLFKGLENLDGNAFVRTAGQLMFTQGWRKDEDGEGFNWSFEGPGFDETWEGDGEDRNGRR